MGRLMLQEADNSMKASVIIPTYNSSAYIRACLRSMAEQTLPPYEVIVVDSSTDGTPDIVRAEFPTVTLCHRDQQTYPGEARNIGVETATGDVVVLLDSDCVADADWLEELLAVYEHKPEATGVAGNVHRPVDDNAYGFVDFWASFINLLGRHDGQIVITPAMFNTSMRRQAYWQIGGCATSFGGEDVLLRHAYHRVFGRLEVAPKAYVTHRNRADAAGLIAHHRRNGHNSVAGRALDPTAPGSFLLRYPFLLPLTPLARFVAIMARLAYHSRGDLRRMLAHPILLWRAVYSWYAGVREAMADSEKPVWDAPRDDPASRLGGNAEPPSPRGT